MLQRKKNTSLPIEWCNIPLCLTCAQCFLLLQSLEMSHFLSLCLVIPFTFYLSQVETFYLTCLSNMKFHFSFFKVLKNQTLVL